MMYNYSYVEVMVKEGDINEAVTNMAIILSSIKYNDKVIEKLIASGNLSEVESTYKIKKPSEDKTNNILDAYDYNVYEE